jgi:Cu(I)/Ag(I) efflux system membrane fusion protein
MVLQKSAVKAGDVLYRVANLESVWVYLDIYEHELGLIRYGQSVKVRSEAWPDPFPGRVWFISPVLNEETRSVKVLVNIANADKRLKPGRFVSAVIRAPLRSDGTLAPTGVEGKWTCAMHPQILQGEGGPCPICGMALTQIPPPAEVANGAETGTLAVPISAVLDSGIRKVVYLAKGDGRFAPVEVRLGLRAGDFYPVIAGLKEGDQVASRGAFLLDSQLQIQGLPSLFYPEGQAMPVGHQHGGSAAPATRSPVPATPSAAPTPGAAVPATAKPPAAAHQHH